MTTTPHRRRLRMAGASLAAVALAGLVGSSPGPRRAAVSTAAFAEAALANGVADTSHAARVRRGKLLVEALACGDCHTPRTAEGKADAAFLLAGHRAADPAPAWDPSLLAKNVGMTVTPTATAYAGPWGVTYARNLTPDPTTGIGGWNAEAFINVLREGRLKPPMPLSYGLLPDSDLEAMFAYLQSLPPVKNLVPFRKLAPPPAPGATPGGKSSH